MKWRKRFLRIIIKLRVIYYNFLSGNRPILDKSKRHQPLLTIGLGEIALAKCSLGYYPSPFFWNSYCHFEAREQSAKIEIHDNVMINNNACIIAERSKIVIKSGCLIGPSVQIFDSDFHHIDPTLRSSGNHISADVIIEENVFIGASVIILKGVTIGFNSVIAAGSVVTQNIPPNSIAGGVPAKVIGHV